MIGTSGAICECGKEYSNFRVYSGADKSLARPGRKQATAIEDFDFRIPYLLSKLEEYQCYLYM